MRNPKKYIHPIIVRRQWIHVLSSLKRKFWKVHIIYVVYVIEHYIKKSVLKLNTSSYPSQDIFKIQSSYDGKEYICKTCHSKAIQGRLPCQAVVNNLNVDDVPTELGNLKKLEQILIAQRIIFEKSNSYAERTTKKN